MAEQVDN